MKRGGLWLNWPCWKYPWMKKYNLYDHFRTLVTREKGHIHGAALNTSRVLVHDGVHLSVAHIHILCVQSGHKKKLFCDVFFLSQEIKFNKEVNSQEILFLTRCLKFFPTAVYHQGNP